MKAAIKAKAAACKRLVGHSAGRKGCLLVHVGHTNQIYLVMVRHPQLTQASFLQQNQMLQNVFLIFFTLR